MEARSIREAKQRLEMFAIQIILAVEGKMSFTSFHSYDVPENNETVIHFIMPKEQLKNLIGAAETVIQNG